ncbi:MAG: alpha/beta hydrolase [Rectinema subterraneum]|uniref:alpha/beta hydrolase n=1 Tax=Rectinema subterraneum TaxID=2653714 RepID=UPI003C7AECE9
MNQKRKKRSVLNLVLTVFAGLVILVTVGFVAWTRLARYPAFPEAAALAKSAKALHEWYVFQPPQIADSLNGAGQNSGALLKSTGFIFYPGGLVDPAAYAPLMKRLSDAGLFSVIVPMPLDLAIFSIDAAKRVMDAYPEIQHWIIGGHSLGGSMAAEFLKKNPGLAGQSATGGTSESHRVLDGLVLLASYPAKTTDLSGFPIRVVSIYGSNDGVLSSEFESSLLQLPPRTQLIRIEGGNHAQFGNYGPQKGDGTATISREAQQERTAEPIVALARTIAGY